MARKESGAKPPSRSQLVREHRSGRLLGTLFGKHSRKWGREDAIVAAISDAHNDGDIDVLGILTPDALNALDRSVFFSGQALYGSVIPHLNASAAEVVRAVKTLIGGGGESGTAGLPINALASWSEKDRSRPRALLDLIDGGSADAAEFLMPILRTGMLAEPAYFLGRTHRFARSPNSDEVVAAIRALGMHDPAGDAEWDALIATLVHASDGDDAATAAVIEAAIARLKAGAGENAGRLEEIIALILSAGTGSLGLYQCADALWIHHGVISPALRADMLGALIELDPAHKVTTEHLDYALADLFKAGEQEQVLGFLEKLVRRHGHAIKLKWFRSVCRAAHEAPSPALHDWIGRWFLIGDNDMCKQMASALFQVEVEGIILDIDFSRHPLRPQDYAYLARKAIGFLFLKPVTAASIVVSLVRAAPPASISELEDLLFDPLLLNYAGIERKLLAPIAKDRRDKAQKVVKRALTRIAAYRADLQAASPIKELHPSERQRQMEWQRNADAMAAAHKQADEKSFFADLFAKVIVLHGQRTISYHRIGKEEPKRFESKMGSFSTSFEMPRIEVADPVGLQHMLLRFCGEERPA